MVAIGLCVCGKICFSLSARVLPLVAADGQSLLSIIADLLRAPELLVLFVREHFAYSRARIEHDPRTLFLAPGVAALRA